MRFIGDDGGVLVTRAVKTWVKSRFIAGEGRMAVVMFLMWKEGRAKEAGESGELWKGASLEARVMDIGYVVYWRRERGWVRRECEAGEVVVVRIPCTLGEGRKVMGWLRRGKDFDVGEGGREGQGGKGWMD